MKKFTSLTIASVFLISLAACSSSDNDSPIEDSQADNTLAGDGLADDLPAEDTPEEGTPEEGTPEEGTPEEGTPEEGTPEEGAPEEGTPEEGAPEEGTPEEGTPEEGTPEEGAPEEGTPEEGTPEEGTPVSGFVPDTDAFYVLQTIQSIEAGQCFESNFVAPESFLDGASHMATCGFFSGQLWRFIDQNNGYYQLQSAFVEGANQCLEGNRFAAEADLGGAAFMADCEGVTGQMWALLDQGNGTFQLQTQFREEENECLEGNQVSDTATLGGAAFMSGCEEVTGQIWSATLESEFSFPE